MKKIIAMLLVLSMLIVGCGQTNKEIKKETQDKNKTETTSKAIKKKVTVTTSFLNDMVKVLVGNKVDLQLIIPAGEDPHLYVAKPEDLEKVTSADLVLYHGLHFEGKMIEVLEQYGKSVTKDFEESDLGTMEEGGKVETDPHFWFDLNLYKKAITKTAEYLSELLPEEKDTIEKNLANYVDELYKLDKEIKEKIDLIPKESRFLITPHDAFNYFSRSYGIIVKAPQGISTDSEVANKEIEETAQFIVDNKIKAIFAESTTNPARMEKLKEVVKSKGFEVKVVSGEGKELFSDSLAPEGKTADTFLDMYRHNVDLIVDNLK